MTFDGEKIRLRPFAEEHGIFLSGWYYSGKYPYFFRHFNSVYRKKDFANANLFLNGEVMVVEKKDGAVVGIMGVCDIRGIAKTAKVLALCDISHRCQGYMHEASLIMGRWFFRDLDFYTLIWDVAANDKRTHQIMETAKFKRIGTVNQCVVNGIRQDEIRYIIDREQYFSMYGGV